MKQRATQHSGRKSRNGKGYSVKHNDRNYDFFKALNIDAAKTEQNIYWNCYDNSYSHNEKDGKMTFEEVEQKFYQDRFSVQWQKTNEKYIKQGHKERCKSFEDWSKQSRNLPEEIHLQVGNIENPCDKKTFFKIGKEYFNRINRWNKAHGKPFQILDMAFHFDEAVPHMQLRRCWQYKDKNGIWCIGQEKALEQAGVDLPEPTKKKGRYNNRKMTFDKMAREMFLECCKEFGVDIETEPIPDARHNLSKDEMIAEKFKIQEAELEKQESSLRALEAEISDLREKAIGTTIEAEKSLEMANKAIERANTIMALVINMNKRLEEQSKEYQESKANSLRKSDLNRYQAELDRMYQQIQFHQEAMQMQRGERGDNYLE